MSEYSSDVHGFFYLFHGGVGAEVLEVPGQEPGVDRAAIGPGEAASPQGEVEACCVGMEPRPAAGGRPGGVEADARRTVPGSGLPDQAQQLIARGHLAAAHACALGTMGGAA